MRRWLGGLKRRIASGPVNRLLARGYESRLYTPTHVARIGGDYYLVDCWHHRVLRSPDLALPIPDWSVLSDRLAGPHSVASDGQILLTEDTGRHRLAAFRVDRDGQPPQWVDDVGLRPHRTLFDQTTGLFYSLASQSQEIVCLENRNGSARVCYRKRLDFLGGAYTRSMALIDGLLYFVSGPGAVTVARYADASYAVEAHYPAPEALASMNDICRLGSAFYITATPCRIVRVRDLAALARGEWEDLYTAIGFRGTPYYLSQIGERIYVPEITEYSSLISFRLKGADIIAVRRQHDFGPPLACSLARRDRLPL